MKSVNLIVYGTLMRGESNSHLCRNAMFISPCEIQGTLYDTGWGFPAFVPDEAGGDVHGELLAVTDATLARMDRLEGCPSLYRRERVTVTVSGGGVAEAWVYVMNRLPAGAKVIMGGDWRTSRM